MRTPTLSCVALALSLSAAFSCRSDEALDPVEREPERPASTPAPTPAPTPAAHAIFDGKTLAGWDGDPRFWSVENGVLVGRSTPQQPCTDSTYVVWRGGEVADFELDFEYRIVGGNSGLQFRSREAGQWKLAGPQADIEDGPDWSGCLYEQDGRGVVARRGEKVQLEPKRRTAESFGDKAQLDRLARKGEWNRYTVRAVGPHLQLALNGVTTVEVLDLDPQRFRPSGLLAFQLHAGDPMQIEVRNVMLTHLEAKTAADVRFFELPELADSAARSVVTPTAGASAPQWVWASPQARDGEVVALQRRFELAAQPSKATLRATADDHLRVYVNGELALRSDEWWWPAEVDVAKLVRAGENIVTAIAKNDGSAAAAWIELTLDGEGGRMLRLVSDGGWSAHGVASERYDEWRPDDFQSALAGAPHVLGAVGLEPWNSMGPAMRGESAVAAPEAEESALAAAELTLPEGFTAELLYSVPKSAQGSWVAICEDPKGRFYVSDQYGALYRVTAPAILSSAATQVETVPLDLGQAHGLCWAFDSLYVVVAEGGTHEPGLYRCRDTDGDDQLDLAQLLRAFEGGGEHGPHAVVLGPDKKLWIVGGNHTKLPEPLDASWMSRNWAEDLLLPRLDDPNGHAVGILAPGGWIVRTDEDAKHWELWAAGFRNAYDIAFDEGGELYTFDSDMEWDVGLPWYRPARVCQVPPGADFGWRHGSGKWPSYYVDSMPATCDIGLASPTGVCFGTASKFEGKYKRAFFAADWAYGTVYAVWGERFEPFVSGKPFPVTDMVIAKDGAMYLTTGGRRTQSGLYRIRWSKDADPAAAAERTRGPGSAPQIAAEERAILDPAGPAPTLEQLRALVERLGAATLASHRARAALERAAPADLGELLANATNPRTVAPLAAAAIRAAPRELREVALRRLDELPLANVGEGYRLDTLRALGLAFLRLELDDATKAHWADKLLAVFPYGMERTDREVAQLLAHLADARMIEPTLGLIAAARTQEEKIWYAYCLRNVKQGWSHDQRVRMLEFFATEAPSFRGGHSLAKYLDRIRAEFVEGFSADERAQLAQHLAPRTSGAVVASAPAASFVRAWTKDELAPLVREPLHGRDFERGRVSFAKARCTECHRIGGDGGSTGPDLTGAGSRFSRLDLLDALLTPSATISDQYQDVELLTRDGDLYVGRVEGEADGLVKLRRLPPQEDVIALELAEIASRRAHPLSRMPSGLVDVLDRDELLDLLAYVLSGADKSDASFGN
jgi:putative heme-binding domain-containing protein